MLLQDLLIHITTLLENVNSQAETMSEVVKNLNPDDPQMAKGWDQGQGWKNDTQGWKQGSGWNPGTARGWKI